MSKEGFSLQRWCDFGVRCDGCGLDTMLDHEEEATALEWWVPSNHRANKPALDHWPQVAP